MPDTTDIPKRLYIPRRATRRTGHARKAASTLWLYLLYPASFLFYELPRSEYATSYVNLRLDALIKPDHRGVMGHGNAFSAREPNVQCGQYATVVQQCP
ncbi:hypothetical protein AK812_SmicGene13995 [Symbiodinium microadriaticum]|uniref:Uncharacterized protein n=1 Tax=Symbiodinium microadriaticum TaxID=2951 RepID=A0A1Q9E6M0_SYMMI|nr:hypothetical protein AK812_SmicGene13995 [Symbiodinium microadriaticum]